MGGHKAHKSKSSHSSKHDLEPKASRHGHDGESRRSHGKHKHKHQDDDEASVAASTTELRPTPSVAAQDGIVNPGLFDARSSGQKPPPPPPEEGEPAQSGGFLACCPCFGGGRKKSTGLQPDGNMRTKKSLVPVVRNTAISTNV